MVKLVSFYPPRGLRIEKAWMQYLWDDKGRRYIDCHTGHGVAFLGHCNPRIVNAVAEQMKKLDVLSLSFDCEARERAVNALSKVLPRGLDNVFFQNSGAEAVELALKITRLATGRRKVVAFRGSFHGRTAWALSVTWNPSYRKPFEPLVPETLFLPWNDVEAVEKLNDEDVAAIIMEPIQGEGGVNPASKEFVKAVRDACDRLGAVMIVDEIQTGCGRTGTVWCIHQYGVEPDVLLAGKALGGGYPASLAAFKDWVIEKIKPGIHGSTYAGNPVACAAVAAAVEVIVSDNVPEKARRTGEALVKLLKERLEDAKIVRKIKGAGLMIGVELRKPPKKALNVMQEKGVLALKAGTTTIRLLPPYMITMEDVEKVVEALHEGVLEEDSS